jgi:hypothetical protein
MQRLYYLAKNQISCLSSVEGLQQIGVPIKHLHVIGSLSQDLDGLPEAGVWQKTELAHGIEWGVGLGGTAGLLGGVLAVSFPPAGLVLGGGALLVGSIAGAGFGGAVGSLMKSHEHNHELDDFMPSIERGELLLMIDVPRADADRIEQYLREQHPDLQQHSSS